MRDDHLLEAGGTIRILMEEDVYPPLGERLIDLLGQVSGPLKFQQGGLLVRAKFGTQALHEEHRSWENTFAQIRGERLKISSDSSVVLALLTSRLPLGVVGRPGAGADHDRGRNVFIHVSGLEHLFEAPIEVVVGVQLIEQILHLGLSEADPDFDFEDLLHQDPRGCLSDIVLEPQQYERVIRAGDICDDCVSTLIQCGLSEEVLWQVRAILDLFRQEARNSGDSHHSVQDIDERRGLISAVQRSIKDAVFQAEESELRDLLPTKTVESILGGDEEGLLSDPVQVLGLISSLATSGVLSGSLPSALTGLLKAQVQVQAEPTDSLPREEETFPEPPIDSRSTDVAWRFYMPYPLATLYNAYRTAVDARERVVRIIYLLEGITRYLSYCLFADMAHRSPPSDKWKKWTSDRLFKDMLGPKDLLIKGLSGFLAKQKDPFFNELCSTGHGRWLEELERDIEPLRHVLTDQKSEWYDATNQMTLQRNIFAHTPQCATEADAKRFLQEGALQELLDTVLKGTRFLANYRLGYFTIVRRNDTGERIYEWTSSMGLEERGRLLKVGLESEVWEDRPTLLNPTTGQLLYLDPFMKTHNFADGMGRRILWMTPGSGVAKVPTEKQPDGLSEVVFQHPRLHRLATTADITRWFLDRRAWKGVQGLELPADFERRTRALGPYAASLDARYERRGRLGAGGMGEVWETFDRTLNKRFALKLLKPELLGSSDARARLQREAQMQMKVEVPGVGKMHHAEFSVEQPYLVMELLEGRTIKELVEEEGPLRPGLAIEILDEVLVILEGIHKAGLIHRDIKPSNIMKTSEGLRIIDFGIALDVDSLRETLTHDVMGSPHYMAPEQQSTRARVDSRADLFAVGKLLFFLLTGLVPDVLQMRSKPALSSNIRESRLLQLFVERATAELPDERFSSVASMREELDNLRERLEKIGPRQELAVEWLKCPDCGMQAHVRSLWVLRKQLTVGHALDDHLRRLAPVDWDPFDRAPSEFIDPITGEDFVVQSGASDEPSSNADEKRKRLGVYGWCEPCNRRFAFPGDSFADIEEDLGQVNFLGEATWRFCASGPWPDEGWDAGNWHHWKDTPATWASFISETSLTFPQRPSWDQGVERGMLSQNWMEKGAGRLVTTPMLRLINDWECPECPPWLANSSSRAVHELMKLVKTKEVPLQDFVFLYEDEQWTGEWEVEDMLHDSELSVETFHQRLTEFGASRDYFAAHSWLDEQIRFWQPGLTFLFIGLVVGE